METIAVIAEPRRDGGWQFYNGHPDRADLRRHRDGQDTIGVTMTINPGKTIMAMTPAEGLRYLADRLEAEE